MSSFDLWPPIAIEGTGSYVPERVITNSDLVKSGLDTTDEWITAHTGIKERRWVAANESTASIATQAARAALDNANATVDEVDLILLATSTPDWPQPATASAVHHALGLRADAGALDVNAVCSGFIYALHAGSSMLAAAESWNTVLVIGADRYSSITNPSDRSTRIFFGDGAGAVLLRKQLEVADLAAIAASEAGIDLSMAFQDGIDAGPNDEETFGLRSIVYTVNHALKDAIIVKEPTGWFEMDGPAVRSYAVPALVDAVTDACTDAGCSVNDLALLIPHQSNQRMLEAAIDELGLPEARLASSVQTLGNTAAASIPLTLDIAARSGRLSTGDLICLAGYGGGLQSAAAIVRWL